MRKLIVGILAPVALVGLILALAGCGSPAVQAKVPPVPLKVPHVGFMSSSSSPAFIEALREGLRELGYVEGKTINIEWRLTKDIAELDNYAAEFVALHLDLILAGGTEATKAAMKVTSTIPIVMTNGGDAVANKLVASLARPGGNVTGLTQISPALYGKRVGLLRDTVPGLSRIAVLWYPDHPTTPRSFAEIEAAAPTIGLQVLSFPVRDASGLDGAFRAAMEGGAGAMLLLRDPFTVKYQKEIVQLAEKNRLPTMYETINYVEAGGLMLYGPSFEGLYRQSASYVDKILKGANPAEMPVQQPTTFELVLNQKAADAIGLVFQESLLVRATKVVR
jgi:putative ABC transport system substrate-binding protein